MPPPLTAHRSHLLSVLFVVLTKKHSLVAMKKEAKFWGVWEEDYIS